LADDMGLGKTMQLLAFLLRRKDEAHRDARPALLIAPTSVVGNWEREIERFAPSLDVVRHYGASRANSASDIPKKPGTLVVTTYGLLRRDAELLSSIDWSVAALDEAQNIKNASSATARAARGLRASHRFALTGTPVENHLGELWSLLHVVSPGLLGSWDAFRERYAAPIERRGDAKARAALHRLLQPFLLRRVKAEVTPQLPPRTEVLHPVELSPEELGLYEQTRRAAIAELAKPPSGPPGQAANKRRFAILATITRLRRLACHPRMLDASSQVASSKLSAFLELVGDLIEGGHRALVFSQFTSHLALVREALEDREVAYLYLDGGTPAPRRAALVTQWQRGQTPLFLISLKAGGTGLNLTAADYVIHLDPWWNPAVEDQASDRAHRIGQTRPVTVVRMVAQGTIEQRVIELHARKRALVESLLAGTDQAARLGVEELLALVDDEDEDANNGGDEGAGADAPTNEDPNEVVEAPES
ncbi:MAG: DEAD/DEAH box helicase, partial [Myxococcales bacterium]|nr:DEAD/DEAH box helicase [Myxococcales bacterium]